MIGLQIFRIRHSPEIGSSCAPSVRVYFIQVSTTRHFLLFRRNLGLATGRSSWGLTNSVYPPRRDASQDTEPQTRRINLVGLKRHPEDGRVGDKGVCKVRARVHAQIMAVDLSRVLLFSTDFASFVTPNEAQ